MDNNIYINKSIEKPLQVMGLRGNYVYAFMIGIGILIIGYFSLNIIIDSIILLVLIVIALIALYTVLKRLNDRFGINGIEKIIAYRLLPSSIQRKKRILIKE